MGWSPIKPKVLGTFNNIADRNYDPLVDTPGFKNCFALVAVFWNGTAILSSPAGWTVAASDVDDSGGNQLGIRLFYKVLDGTEVDTTFVNSGASRNTLFALLIGPNRKTPVVFDTLANAQSGNPAAHDIDASVKKASILWFGVASSYNVLGGDSALVAADLVITGATAAATLSDVAARPLRAVLKYGMFYGASASVNINVGDIDGRNALGGFGVEF